MSSQASVRSIDTLKDLRVALALYGEDTLGASGAVEAEVRRTLRWLQEEQPVYWQDQIKRRREQVSIGPRRGLQEKPAETGRLQPADVRAEREPAKGRGQPAGCREAAGGRQEMAAALQAGRPRVSRQRPANQRPGGRAMSRGPSTCSAG